MWYEFNFVPERNLFWKYVKSTLGTDNYIFEGRGDWGKSHFFSLGSKSHFLFLGVHGAGEGEVTGIGEDACIIPLRLATWYPLRCLKLQLAARDLAGTF